MAIHKTPLDENKQLWITDYKNDPRVKEVEVYEIDKNNNESLVIGVTFESYNYNRFTINVLDDNMQLSRNELAYLKQILNSAPITNLLDKVQDIAITR